MLPNKPSELLAKGAEMVDYQCYRAFYERKDGRQGACLIGMINMAIHGWTKPGTETWNALSKINTTPSGWLSSALADMNDNRGYTPERAAKWLKAHGL